MATIRDERHIRRNIERINFWNDAIMELGDERAEEIWLQTYPDGADTEDVRDMASDIQTMNWLQDDYSFIMKHFG